MPDERTESVTRVVAKIGVSPRGIAALLSDQELCERVDAGACESDRAFFRQHPQRNFRLRPAWAVEIEEFARKGTIERKLPDELCWWVLVHQLIAHKVRLRWPLPGPHDFYPGPPEEIALAVWDQNVPLAWKQLVRDLQCDVTRVLRQHGEIS